MGNITLELDHTQALPSPMVDNFLKYVDSGFYNGTVFHRVIGNFMAEGGWVSPSPAAAVTEQMAIEKPTERPPIKNESGNGLSNLRGTIAMARTNNPNSATSQFFINLFDRNKNLDNAGGGYAVFGKVTEGMDVVDKIAKVLSGECRPTHLKGGRS